MAYIYNRQDQKDLRRTLRRNQSSVERLLWSKLRNRQLLGFKFRRQYGIGPFSVDCCCPSAKLVIEEDGDSHYTDDLAKVKDIERQKYTCSKEYFIKEYGDITGLEKFENFSKQRTLNGGYSKISITLSEVKASSTICLMAVSISMSDLPVPVPSNLTSLDLTA